MTVLFNTRRVSKKRMHDYLRGASSIFNLRGDTTREYRLAGTSAQADKSAIENDWRAVSSDLTKAIKTYRKNVGQ